jgi:hypothetical protein
MPLRYAELEKFYEGLVALSRCWGPSCLWGANRVLGTPAILNALARRSSREQLILFASPARVLLGSNTRPITGG